MLKLCSVILISLIAFESNAWIDIENSPKAQNRIKLTSTDFNIEAIKYKNFHFRAILDETSFEWIRVDNSLLVPRVRLKLQIGLKASNVFIKYRDKIINFQQGKQYAYSELFYSLFEKDHIEVYENDLLIGKINLKTKANKKRKENILIDYSCSRNALKIRGLSKNELFSIGCKTRPVGSFGNEKPMLEIMWSSPDLMVSNQEVGINHAAFLSNNPVRIKVRNIRTGKLKILTLKATLPKRLHRLFTAYGLGPYAFNTKIENSEGETFTKNEGTAPALFLYSNYKISDTTSVRGFNAAIFKDSVFDNAGLYIGSDFGFSFDNRLYFTTLLGVQYLYFRFDEDADEVSEAIFPQGLEFMYRHAFGIPNYIVSGGIFLSTDDSIDYENVWLRWGRDYFWELNLISWGKENFETRTWGISIGFPFKGFL